MRIAIGKKYEVTSDGTQFKLIAVKMNKDKESVNFGKKMETTVGFYGTLIGVLDRALTEDLLNCDATTIKEVVAIVKEYRLYVEEIEKEFELR